MIFTERRFLSTELRALPAVKLNSNSPGTLVGYASKFTQLSEDLGGFREQVAPTAFNRALTRPDDVRALINHDPSLVLGRVAARTLRLSTDSIGLRCEITLPDTSYARDLYQSVQRGDVSQMSFAFTPDEDSWDGNIRTLRDVHLQDISAVTYPAYPDTEINTASAAAVMGRSLFPEGVPVEVRSHAAPGSPLAQERRQQLVNRVLSL